MLSSEEYYNKFAPTYRAYSEKYKHYLNSVDAVILSQIKERALSGASNALLDVGSGDGIRAIRLAKQASIAQLGLLDNSDEMISLCKKVADDGVDVFKCNITEPCASDVGTYNYVTCLWNVLGHIPSRDKRVHALMHMRTALKKDGMLFVDVNNRHNVPQYGLKNAMRNVLHDTFTPGKHKNDFPIPVPGKNGEARSLVHIFSHAEMKQLFSEAGLRIQKRYMVDYRTGKLRKIIFAGQLLYVLKAA